MNVIEAGSGFQFIQAILLQASNMQQDDGIRAFRGKARPLLAKALCGERALRWNFQQDEPKLILIPLRER